MTPEEHLASMYLAKMQAADQANGEGEKQETSSQKQVSSLS